MGIPFSDVVQRNPPLGVPLCRSGICSGQTLVREFAPMTLALNSGSRTFMQSAVSNLRDMASPPPPQSLILRVSTTHFWMSWEGILIRDQLVNICIGFMSTFHFWRGFQLLALTNAMEESPNTSFCQLHRVSMRHLIAASSIRSLLLWNNDRPPRGEGFLFEGVANSPTKGGKKTPLSLATRS